MTQDVHCLSKQNLLDMKLANSAMWKNLAIISWLAEGHYNFMTLTNQKKKQPIS